MAVRGLLSLLGASRGLALALSLALACCLAPPLLAVESAAPGRPSLPGEPCGTPPYQQWNEAETWAWGQICQGNMADFNAKFRGDLSEGQPLPPDQEQA